MSSYPIIEQLDNGSIKKIEKIAILHLGKYIFRTTYHFNDLLHNFDDLPAIEYSNGEKHWYQNGYRHRLNGPASIFTSDRHNYYINGKLIVIPLHIEKAGNEQIKEYLQIQANF